MRPLIGLAASLSVSMLLIPGGGAHPAAAAAAGITSKQLLPVYRPIAHELLRSKIPVLVPTWLPKMPYAIKHPVFLTLPPSPAGIGQGYCLELHDDPKDRSHATEISRICGWEGRGDVGSQTTPVYLGQQGWAYIDPRTGGNQGYTIMVVRSFPSSTSDFGTDYTYTIDHTCFEWPYSAFVACLKHVARSLARFTGP